LSPEALSWSGHHVALVLHLQDCQITKCRQVIGIRNQAMIRKLASGEFRLYSRKKSSKTGKRRNLGTFATRAAAEKHERDVQYFKRHG
jgi:hypothetical protein